MVNLFGISDALPHMAPKTKQKHIYHSKQTLQNMNRITSILFIPLLKTTLTLILSFSVLSLLFFRPSRLPFSHLLTFSWQFLSHGADKNCIFLLCNGLLVLVAKYSYWTLKTHEDSLMFKGYDLEPLVDLSVQFGSGKTILPEYAHNSIASHVSFWLSDSPLDQTEPSHLVKDVVTEKKKDVEKRSEIRDRNHEDDDYKVAPDKELYMEEDDEYDEEGENAKMSTEELNRKIEDFIRRRKEELRIEAQQQLIVVYD